MTFYTLPGCYSNEETKKIQAKLEGKTFLNLHVEGGGIAGNNTVVVSTEERDDNKEGKNDLMEMVISMLAIS